VQDLQDNQGSLAPADPSAAAYSPERPLITNKSNKLEWQEGQPHSVCANSVQMPILSCICVQPNRGWTFHAAIGIGSGGLF